MSTHTHQLKLTLSELLKHDEDALITELSQDTGLEIASAEFSIAGVEHDSNLNENVVILEANYQPEHDQNTTEGNVALLRQQTEEFDEMGRNYPAFGAGNIGQRTHELLLVSRREAELLRPEVRAAVVSLAGSGKEAEESSTDMPTGAIFSILDVIEEGLQQPGETLLRTLIRHSDPALDEQLSGHELGMALSDLDKIFRSDLSAEKAAPLRQSITRLVEDLNARTQEGDEPVNACTLFGDGDELQQRLRELMKQCWN